jgi:hypothetical protein
MVKKKRPIEVMSKAKFHCSSTNAAMEVYKMTMNTKQLNFFKMHDWMIVGCVGLN